MTAYEIIGRSGLEHLHARSVAAELNMNHAAVHYYFKTREDLLIALVGYAQKRFDMDLNRVTENLTHPSKRLEAHIALYEAYAKPASRYFRALSSLFVAAAWSERVKDAIRRLLEHHAARLATHLDEAKTAGLLRAESPFTHPQTLSNYLFGISMQCQMAQGQDPTPEIDRLLQSLFVNA